MKLLEKIEPQPPKGVKYMLGGETWLAPERRSPVRLRCEEWGNLGALELNSDIKKNPQGLRLRTTDIAAPSGALGFAERDGVYSWTDMDMFGRGAGELADISLRRHE